MAKPKKVAKVKAAPRANTLTPLEIKKGNKLDLMKELINKLSDLELDKKKSADIYNEKIKETQGELFRLASENDDQFEFDFPAPKK